MRSVVRRSCSYEEYGRMIDYIDTTCPYGIFEARYNPREFLAIIGFWDSDYIPPTWEEWVVRPISTVSNTDGVSEEYD